jgi:transposase
MVSTARLINRAAAVKAVDKHGGDIQAAARRLGFRPCYVRKWYNQWQETGSLNDLTRTGRPALLSGSVLEELQDLVLEEQSSTSALKLLIESGKVPASTHRTTVWRAAKKGNNPLEMGPERVIPMMNAAARAKRKAFAQYHLDQKTDPSKVFAVDSTMIRLGKPGVSRKVWKRKGQRLVRAMPHKLPQIHVYGGICSVGKSRLVPCTGTSGMKSKYTKQKRGGGIEPASGVGSTEYIDILDEYLVPDAEDLFASVGVDD